MGDFTFLPFIVGVQLLRQRMRKEQKNVTGTHRRATRAQFLSQSSFFSRAASADDSTAQWCRQGVHRVQVHPYDE